MKCKIQKLEKDEIPYALNFVDRVFTQFLSSDYSDQGVSEFHRSIWDHEYLAMLTFYGAFLSGKLVGIIATRSEGKHIALFFVDGKFQGKGIGKTLFKYACVNNRSKKMTVNSSLFALPVYRKLGFAETDSEQNENGVIYTPMECDCIDVWNKMLTNTDNNLGCTACERLLEIGEKTDVCYNFFNRFADMLESKNSFVRNRAILLLGANARWDIENKFDQIINTYLTHISDEKPITSRQCIKSLPEIAVQKPALKKKILLALENADSSSYNESMRSLIDKDIAAAIKKIKE